MENGQFERLLAEIAEWRRHTEDVAGSLRRELMAHTDVAAEETRRHFNVVAEGLVRSQERRMEESRSEILAIMEKVLGREGLARSLERVALEPAEEFWARFTAWLDKLRAGRPPWTREDAERFFREMRERRAAPRTLLSRQQQVVIGDLQ